MTTMLSREVFIYYEEKIDQFALVKQVQATVADRVKVHKAIQLSS